MMRDHLKLIYLVPLGETVVDIAQPSIALATVELALAVPFRSDDSHGWRRHWFLRRWCLLQSLEHVGADISHVGRQRGQCQGPRRDEYLARLSRKALHRDLHVLKQCGGLCHMRLDAVENEAPHLFVRGILE